jgi:flavin reductase (DIM6/NTAB) family NADH-FMN oxidoreductase RutF
MRNLANLFNKIDVKTITDNFFQITDEDWMLITAGNRDKFNTMTASWGTFGILWNKPITICFIRPHRYTFVFAEESEGFTLSFFPENYRKILNFCGSRSGRDTDKMKETGLVPVETETGLIAFEQARLIIECKKIYSDFIREENFILKELIHKNYPSKDFHKFYIGEIVNCYKK